MVLYIFHLTSSNTGAGVIPWGKALVLSWHPKKKPGVLQVLDFKVEVGDFVCNGVVCVLGVFLSLHP
jgi:hypothetical protein